jgi:hypothetical protein
MRGEARQGLVEGVTSYHVTVQRGDSHWLIHVLEIDQWTQARRLGEAQAMIRDLISVMTEVDPESVEFTMDVQLPHDAQQHVTRAEHLRDQSAKAQREAAEQWRAAASALSEQGLTMCEIGEILHLSHQRAQQLVKS